MTSSGNGEAVMSPVDSSWAPTRLQWGGIQAFSSHSHRLWCHEAVLRVDILEISRHTSCPCCCTCCWWVGCVSHTSLCCRYKRVFSVGTHGITTYNPTTLEVTNQVSISRLPERGSRAVQDASPCCSYHCLTGACGMCFWSVWKLHHCSPCAQPLNTPRFQLCSKHAAVCPHTDLHMKQV